MTEAVFDRSGKLVGYRNNREVYDSRWKKIATIIYNQIIDTSGKTIARVIGNLIQSADGASAVPITKAQNQYPYTSATTATAFYLLNKHN